MLEELLTLHERRHAAILENWKHKKKDLRRVVEGLEGVQRRAVMVRHKIEEVALHMEQRDVGVSGSDHPRSLESVALNSPSPPRDLATCATQTMLDDPQRNLGPTSCARLTLSHPSVHRSSGPQQTWSERRESLKQYFDSIATLSTNAPHVNSTKRSSSPTNEQDNRTKARKIHSSKQQGEIGSVVEGLMAAALPTIVDRAKHMRRTASKLSAQSREGVTRPRPQSPHPSRDTSLLEVCRALCSKDSTGTFCTTTPPFAPPESTGSTTHVHICVLGRVADEGKWCSCALLFDAVPNPKHLWLMGEPHVGGNPNFPLWIGVGCWRGQVLHSSPDDPLRVSLEHRYVHAHTSAMPKILMDFSSFEDMQLFVETFKDGQRSIAAEWVLRGAVPL